MGNMRGVGLMGLMVAGLVMAVMMMKADGAAEAATQLKATRMKLRDNHATMAKLGDLYGDEVVAKLEASEDSSGLTILHTTIARAQHVLRQSQGQMRIAAVDHANDAVMLLGTPTAEVMRALQADSRNTVASASHLLKLSPVVVDLLHSIAEKGDQVESSEIPDALRIALQRDVRLRAADQNMPWQLRGIDERVASTSATYFGKSAMGAMLQRAAVPATNSAAAAPRCDFAKLETRPSGSGQFLRVSGIHGVAKRDHQTRECFVALVTMLSLSTDIQSVDLVYDAQILNIYASAGVQSGVRDVFPLWKRGLNGTDQVVALGDSGLDLSHCLFRDDDWTNCDSMFSTTNQPTEVTGHRKVVQYVAHSDNRESSRGHGSHVAGTIAGQTLRCARKEQKYNGIAMGAKLAIFDMGVAGQTTLSPPDDLTDMFAAAKVAGARIHVNSWGTYPSGRNFYYYSTFDAQVDDYLSKNNDMLAIFAVGNCGEYVADRCDRYFEQSSVTFPATSKNGIGVGAVGSLRDGSVAIDHLKGYSSRGPTADGRIKPDVVASSSFIFSAKAAHKDSTCDQIGLEGTSIASGIVGAAAALVQEYFARGYYPSTTALSEDSMVPSNAVLKAMLINSAVSVQGIESGDGEVVPTAAPDFNQGHGRVTLDTVLPFDNEFKLHVIENVCDVVTEFTTSIQVRGTDRPIQATLVWMDPPGAVDQFKDILINNLDLTVETPDTTYFPNNKPQADDVNTVEKIIIPTSSLTVGDEFDIKVTCESIAQGPQAFAVVVTGLFDVVGNSTTFGSGDADAYEPGFDYPGCEKDVDSKSDPTNAVWAAARDLGEFISHYRGTDAGAIVIIIVLFVVGILCGGCCRNLCCPPKQIEHMQEKLYMDLRTHKLYAKKPLTMVEEETSQLPNFMTS